MVKVNEDIAGEERGVDVPAAHGSTGAGKPDAGLTGAATGHEAGDERPAPPRRRRARVRPAGMSMSVWRAINAATWQFEQVRRLERMVSVLPVAQQSLFAARPLVRQLIQSPPLPRFVLPTMYWPSAGWSSAVDLLRATSSWPAFSGVTLMTDQTRRFLGSITQTLTWQLDLWSGQQSLEGRLLLAEAHHVREHLLSEDAGDLGPVEEFAFEWLGYSRPPRAEEQAGLVEAVIEVLLSASWQVTPARARTLLRKEVAVTRRSTRPFWEREINGRPVISGDLLVPTRLNPDGAALISVLAGGHDVERDALDRVAGAEIDPAVRWLMSELTAVEMDVVWCHVDGGVTWRQAALLCGQDEPVGESVRRKVKRLVRRHRVRGIRKGLSASPLDARRVF